MIFEEAEQIRRMIDDHWKLRMGEEVADLWLGAIVPKDCEIATRTVAWLAKTMHMPPRISDFEEVYAMLGGSPTALRPAESCVSCGGDSFVLVGLRSPTRTQWMIESGLELPDHSAMMEEWASCPDCNADTNTSFPRHNGSLFTSPDPAMVRQRMAPAVQQQVPKGAQKLPEDTRRYLRDMRGIMTEFEQTDSGACEQCGNRGDRYYFGALSLCERCCSQRQKVADRLATADIVDLLRATK